jgi:TonB family protein
MLLPESDRRTLPFVVSVTVQCSLVLLLAIPWTVQTLRNRTSFQLPVLLNLQPLKPVQANKTPPTRNATDNSLSLPSRQIRVFYAPSVKSNNSTADPFTTAPVITFDPGMPVGFGEAAHVSDVLVRSGVRPPPSPNIQPTTETPERVIVVGGKIQAAKLIRQVQPIYPALARQIRVQGVVALEAIIGIDGTIQQLRALNGHPLLIPSAVQAVQQWMYSPTVLNGKAVEVKTTIEVRFTLF